MAKPRVLVTSMFLKPGDKIDLRLKAAGLETVFNPWHGRRTEEEMIEILREIDGAIVSLDPFTPRVVEAAKQLKVVSRTGVGYDTIDVKSATRQGVAVCIALGSNHVAVADYAMALILQCSRQLMENLSEVPAQSWRRHQGKDLSGKTLGILGLGTIGKEVAKRARGFDMRVIAHDIVRYDAFAEQHSVTFVPLDQLLSESDFVSLHLPLDEGTYHIIDDNKLGMMKPSAYLINTARGGILDSVALFRALQSRSIAGAALDVFEKEPLEADSPLRGLDNLYLSPHVAGMSDEAMDAMGAIAAENVVRMLAGQRPLHVVNPEVLG